MAARKPKAGAPLLFSLAEKQIVALYDAGVLSPAVLHHVIAAYADSGVDWSATATLKTVDKHSVQEAVVLTMMPGRALRSAQKDFLSVVEHLTGNSAVEETEDDESLLAQLGGNDSDGKRTAAAKKTAPKQKSAGFNPLVGARAVGKG
ncbi:hypothetical protein [Caballeronia sp. BR00000012568055]|uniref:hypothetical protein n=1 Tax=Caballeronia sp. BR00000012568055 TaxID=2918761 RepID=UPI0023F746EE|nr:hypothetical protein [Caballeronia sp. BR00000012568055]